MTEQERKRAVEAGPVCTEAEKQCQGNCANCGDQERCIPFFDHQNTMMHYNWVNKRSMIITVVVCVTMLLTNWILATNHTEREKIWKEMIESLINRTTVTEVDNGQQNADP